MYWNHRCSADWLAARKQYLTASQIGKLLPTTPTGRPRNIEPVFLEIWADKQACVTEDQIESRGAMARGHIFEKYAISEYNRHFPEATLYHWDDKIIFNDKGVAYSPDALNVEPLDGIEFPNIGATLLGEVKSYSAGQHYVLAKANKLQLAERWQIATALYVSPTIEQGNLILFNPDVAHQLFVHEYRRDELQSELEMIDEIAESYQSMTEDFQDYFNTISYDSWVTSDDIYQQERSNQLTERSCYEITD